VGLSIHSNAVGLAPGNSIFGGNGVNLPDTYIFTYNMTVDGDNLVLAPGTQLNNDGPLFFDQASGGAAGGAGLYRVYATWPLTNNVSVTSGPTQYQLLDSNNVPLITTIINQNATQGGPTPPDNAVRAGDEWVYLGSAVLDGTSTYRVTQQPTLANQFVSMRSEGILFEPVVIPEPATAGLIALAALGLVAARRRS
jgi:hypothetical protein